MKPRTRVYDPFASANAWTPRARSGAPAFAHTAANSAFLPTQHGPTTQFNVAGAQPSRAAMLASPERSLLESHYPAIAQAITLLWGYPEMNQYFEKLWLGDERAEPIHPEAMADLMLLARIHQHLAPVRAERTMAAMYGPSYEQFLPRCDPWADAPKRR